MCWKACPHGMQAPLGEGGGLVSEGEGQRVRLGRAMLRSDVRLVILDEPFRGLDRTKRRMLLGHARKYWRDATIICITHDVAETLGFDQVLVIEGGQLAEAGAPFKLTAQPDSRYRALLQAEKVVRDKIWAHPGWRRLRIERGQLAEARARSRAMSDLARRRLAAVRSARCDRHRRSPQRIAAAARGEGRIRRRLDRCR